MFGSALLGVATGLVLIYIVLSLIITSSKETIEAYTKSRSKNLEKGIAEIFRNLGSGAVLVDHAKFYDHPLISALYPGASFTAAKGAGDLPSYIPSKSFSAAVFNLYGAAASTAEAVAAVRTAAAADDSPVGKAVVVAIDNANGDLDRARAELEAWYDSVMERVAGWYKRHNQKLLFWAGLVIAVALNANSVIIAQALYSDAALRSRVEALAGRVHDEDAAAKVQPATAKAGDQAKGQPKPAAPATTGAAESNSAAAQQTAAAQPAAVPKSGKPIAKPAVPATPAQPGVAPGPVTPAVAVTPNCAVLSASEETAVDSDSFNSCVSGLDARLRSTGIPIGWTSLGKSRAKAYLICSGASCDERDWVRVVDFIYGLILLILGYLATAAALTLGAPFWFDVLNKIMVIRSTVKPREKSQEEGSKD